MQTRWFNSPVFLCCSRFKYGEQVKLTRSKRKRQQRFSPAKPCKSNLMTCKPHFLTEFPLGAQMLRCKQLTVLRAPFSKSKNILLCTTRETSLVIKFSLWLDSCRLKVGITSNWTFVCIPDPIQSSCKLFTMKTKQKYPFFLIAFEMVRSHEIFVHLRFAFCAVFVYTGLPQTTRLVWTKSLICPRYGSGLSDV